MSHSKWVLDFGASFHMSLDSLYFASMSHMPSILVMTAYDTPMLLVSVDSVVTHHLSLPNIYLILKLTLNLAFVCHLYDFSDYLVIFSSFFYIGSVVSNADWDIS